MMQQNLSSKRNNLRVYIGSSLLFAYIVISTLIIGPIILLASVLPFSIRYQIAQLWIKTLFWVLKTTCGLTYEVRGLENIPKNQSCIVLSKHQSAWETVALRLFLPPQTALLKRSLLWIPIGGWALATLKPIAIDRENQREALKALIEQGMARLKEGLFVVIFPEGTRAAPGENKKFNAGGAMLAQKSAYPVIPLAHNAGEFWPRYSFLKYPGTIQVRIGPVIQTEGKKAKEINAEAETWIAQAMAEISQST
ncbi:lysophospholipid acyltransferase family protein [Methylomarinum sp. Ch1-1]|uniref:Lysophospholipid acyltransferase family protein n=1 Tax=Methylomarinum roseum TaxID=3067653 RepID=A0AAU7NXQ5_9GAMM|nr:lysophospholipid acyltransferase family protein [Methylomarinum sp. Ch1-1]MDP4522114.1 lysophospholipid acyltransferase family protein [Methylomarinum sp. Ch1-1]